MPPVSCPHFQGWSHCSKLEGLVWGWMVLAVEVWGWMVEAVEVMKVIVVVMEVLKSF